MKIIKEFFRKCIGITNRVRPLFRYGNHNLSMVDNVYAVFVGATLALTFSGWTKEMVDIVLSILMVAFFVIIFSLAACNQSSTKFRWGFYALAVVSSVLGVWFIMYISGYDLKPEIHQLVALPLGVIFWALSREASIFLVNAVSNKSKNA